MLARATPFHRLSWSSLGYNDVVDYMRGVTGETDPATVLRFAAKVHVADSLLAAALLTAYAPVIGSGRLVRTAGRIMKESDIIIEMLEAFTKRLRLSDQSRADEFRLEIFDLAIRIASDLGNEVVTDDIRYQREWLLKWEGR